MAKAIESAGVTLSVSSGSPTTFAAVGNITAIRGTGAGAGVQDITNVEDTRKRKLMDLPDEGNVTLELNYDPDNATHIILRNARRNRTKLEFMIRLTDSPYAMNTTLTFYGYVLAFALGVQTSDAVRANITLAVVGASSGAAAVFTENTDDRSLSAWERNGALLDIEEIQGPLYLPPTYATWNPSEKSARYALTFGDLMATPDGTSNYQLVKSNVYVSSGKRYAEFVTSNWGSFGEIGIASGAASVNSYLGNDANGYGWHVGNPGYRYHSGSTTFYSLAPVGCRVSMLFDATNGILKFWLDGVDKGDIFSGIAGSFAAALSQTNASGGVTANFGASAWTYTPPAGYTGWY